MNISQNRNEQGFSLIEVLIAMVVLSIGLLGIAKLQGTAMTGNVFSRDGTVAVQLAEEMIERVRAHAGNDPADYDDIDTSGSCSGSAPAKTDCDSWKARLAASSLSNAVGTVDVVQDSPMSEVATIEVNLTWGGGRSVSFKTMLETWGS